MSVLTEYLHTDWVSMTLHDWLGMFITVVVFFGMVAGYIMVFNPRNKKDFESRRNLPLDEDEQQLVVGDKR
jgi:cytochrome c oxidase cbb3-type subunit 4